MIYKSYDMDDIPAARAFAELSLHFATYEGTDDWHKDRARNAFDECKDIQRELEISDLPRRCG